MKNTDYQTKEFFQITYLTKVKIANLNSDEGIGGNITTIKKIKGFDDEQYVYVSGQALRRYLKDTLHQLGEKLSFVDNKGNPKVKDVIENAKIKKDKESDLIKKVIDLDLFGYMLPDEKSLYGRRWSPVKVTPLVSLLKYEGHKDYLTRKQDTEGKGRSGNIVQVETDTFNFMSGTIMIDTSSIGNLVNEFTYEIKEVLDIDEKKKRVNTLIEAVKNFNGGAKQARLLNDFSYKFVIATQQKYGNPFLLDVFDIKIKKDGDVYLNIHPIIETVKDYQYTLKSIIVGLRTGIFANEEEIIKSFKDINIDTVTPNQALDSLKATK